jgi:coenzyme F420-dependent glucose-6-phosphate dehydrogenase
VGVLGGMAQTTRRLRVHTSVTCPTVRLHPAIVAQAAATVSTMMPARFGLGVGSGEALLRFYEREVMPRIPC